MERTTTDKIYQAPISATLCKKKINITTYLALYPEFSQKTKQKTQLDAKKNKPDKVLSAQNIQLTQSASFLTKPYK